MAKRRFEVGDQVAYSAGWLRSIGAYSGDLPHARGVILSLKDVGPMTIADVDWKNGDIPSRVNTANLVRKDRISQEV